MTAVDWAAHIVERNGRELAESFLNAARNADWHAVDALTNRFTVSRSRRWWRECLRIPRPT
jgi:hypothetical protein